MTQTPPRDALNPLPHPPSVLGVKLSIPRLSQTQVERSNVLAMLGNSVGVPVTVVAAPAGYGKTTAVAQWANASPYPVSWISLGPEDNNASRFLSYLVTAIKSADPGPLQKLLNDPSQFADIQGTIEVALQAMNRATRDFFLVLDDFDAITNPDILRAVTFLINHLPPQAHLIIVGRSTPRLPLSRLRAHDALQQISLEDLEFSLEESLAFRSAAGITDIDEGQWANLATRMEGWVTGLQLARLSLKGQRAARVERFVATIDGRLQEIDDYLLEEVIAGLPADLRHFLLRSSILPYLTPDLCDYVFDTDRSAVLLRELRERSLFVMSHDPQQQLLRYHRLFADALKRRLADEVDPREIADIHSKAATWLADRDQLEQALQHAIASRRWDIATPLVKRIGATRSVTDRVLSIRYWLNMLPTDIVMSDPDLRFFLLWNRAVTGDFSEAAAELALSDRDDPDPSFAAREHTVKMQTSYARADIDSMLDHAQRAIELTPPDLGAVKVLAMVFKAAAEYLGGEYEAASTTFADVRRVTAVESLQWMRNRGEVRYADLLCLRGQLDDATTLLMQLKVNTALARHTGDTQVFWFLASIHLERNELDLAETAVAQALEIAALTNAKQWTPPVLITRAMIEWARGDAGAAHETNERAHHEAKQLGNVNYLQRAEALQAMMWIAKGQQILADRWYATADLTLTWTREFNQPSPALAACRLLATHGDPDGALGMLDPLIAATTQRRRTGDLVRLHTMRAGFLNRLNRTDDAAQALSTAIELGAPGGFLRSFLDEGTTIAGLFNHPLIREHTHRHYAQTVRRSFDAQAAGLSLARQPQLEALSPRELDVLRLVAAGRSNRSIAHELFISEPTVKKHISNIYGKLNVLNRVQAVSVARELGVL